MFTLNKVFSWSGENKYGKNALIIFISLFWLEQVILFFKFLYVIKQYIQNIEISANIDPPQCIFNLYKM